MSWREKATEVTLGQDNPAVSLARDWRSRAQEVMPAATAPTVQPAPAVSETPSQPKNEAGYIEGFGAGTSQLASGFGQMAAVYGLTDPDETADFVANQNRAFNEVRGRYPENVRQQISDIENSDGFFSTIGNVASNPRGASYLIVEQLPNSLPAMAGGAAGAAGGAQVGGIGGAAVGSVVPGAGTALGGAVGSGIGAVTGGLGGAFAASVPVEIGAWINQALGQRGVDITDANALRAAYRNPELMAEIRGEAERKGLTTAAADAAFNLFAGRFLKGAAGSSLPRRIVAGAKDIGVQAGGEMASEGLGQVAAYKGDLSKVSGSDIALEGILTLPQSAAESAGGLLIRNRVEQSQQAAADAPRPMKDVTPVATATPAAPATPVIFTDQAVTVPNTTPVVDRDILAQVMADENASAADLATTMDEIAPPVESVASEPVAPQIGQVIEQVVPTGEIVRGTVQQISQVGDNTVYFIQNSPEESPLIVDPTDGPISVLGSGQSFLTPEPAETAAAVPTRADLEQALENAQATDLTPPADVLPPAPPATTTTFRDRLTTMSQSDLMAAYEGKNRRNREMAREELERRFPGWNVTKAMEVASAAAEVNQTPTQAQKEAGNYKMGHVNFEGMDISIETPAGGQRSGTAPDGTAWSVTMPAHYGYIRRTEGADGDHLDVYVGPNMASKRVWVIDQVDPTNKQFDEVKAFIGFGSARDVLAAYDQAFSDGRAADRIGKLSGMSVDDFKTWAKSNSKAAYSYTNPTPAADVASDWRAKAEEVAPTPPASVQPETPAVQPETTPAPVEATPSQENQPTPQPEEQKPSTEAPTQPEPESPAVEQPKMDKPAPETPAEPTAQESPKSAEKSDAGSDLPTTPRARRLEDVGEEMAGKRAEHKRDLDKAAGTEAAKDIVRLTDKPKLWKSPVEESTSGAKAYNQAIYDAIPPFSTIFRSRFMGSTRSRWSSDRGVSWEDKLKQAFDPAGSSSDATRDRIKELASDYAATVKALGDGLADAKSIAEAKQAILDMLVDKSKMKEDKPFDYPLNDFGREVGRFMDAGSKLNSWNMVRNLVSTYSWPGSMSDNSQPKTRTSVEKKLIRPSLLNVDRQGLKDWREGRNVTPQEFMDTFGFRGVEFGEWVRAGEGQAHLNNAYDAFMDLANRMNVQPKAMSLGGKLGFAFGSRGSGEHAAHFEPDTNVINLTKTKGDGSVAHEWAHALDHALGRNGKLVQAMYANLRYKPIAQEDIEKQVMSFLRGTSYYSGMRSMGTTAMAKHYLERIYSNPTRWRTQRAGQTDFSTEADALGKNYWGLNHELFARAWESFIYDTMAGQSPYLVNGWVADKSVTKDTGYRGRPYPTGQERGAFNELFDDFLNAIEFTDQGPVAKADYKLKAEQADEKIAEFARELEAKLPEMAKEVEDGQRSVQRPEVSSGVSSGDGGASTANVSAPQGDQSASSAGERGDRGGNADVPRNPDADTDGTAWQRPGSGASGSGDRVRGDDTVPSVADEEYAAEEVGDVPSVQGVGTNHVIAVGALDEKRSQRQKAKDNLRILKLVKELEGTGRPATSEEQALMAKYTGWGSLKDAFPDTDGTFKDGWKDIGTELKSVLSEEEYKTALRTIPYAHYTSEVVVRGMWAAMQRLGFKAGTVFEPGMGIGNFAGMMPTSMQGQVMYSGLEVDPMTARVSRLLYPQSSVRITDFVKAPFPENMFDVAIGNPPFADIKVKSDPKYSAEKFSLHNYFFAKTLDMIAPGGVVGFVTSRYTMDSVDDSARRWMYEKADLVGAIRLPNTAFKTNAHTEVVTDIIFLRKRLPGEEKLSDAWLGLNEVRLRDADGKGVDININAYFNKNPAMVLGNPVLTSSQFRANDYTVEPVGEKDLQAQLAEAIQRLPENVITEIRREDQTGKDFTPTEAKEGAYYVKDGALMQVDDGIGVPVKLRGSGVEGGMTKGDMAKVKALIPIRDALRETLDMMSDRVHPDALKKAQAKLSKHYDAFVSEYGPITKVEIDERTPPPASLESLRNEMRDDFEEAGRDFDEGDIDLSKLVDATNPSTGKRYTMYELAAIRQQRREELEAQGKTVYEGSFNPDEVPLVVTEKYPNLDVFRGDPEYYNLMILEDYDPATGKAAKRPVFERNIMADIQKPKLETATDALNYSLATQNKVDIELMSAELQRPAAEILEELESQNIIYRIPGYDGDGQPVAPIYKTADDYLSGKVKDKLKYAEHLAKIDPYYKKNVEALKSVQPKDIPVSEISTVLGAPYFTSQVVADFAQEKLGLRVAIKHSSVGNIWTVTVYNRWDANNNFTWGTKRMEAGEILENLLSKRTISIYDTVEGQDGKEARVLNVQETENAREKARAIQESFDGWVWKSSHADAVHTMYNDNFNNVVPRKFDGQHLTPAHSPLIKLRPHQKDFVWRVLQSGNSYAAHAVGAGKTLEMIVSGMEMRRLGVWRKPMYVVPNHMLAQFSGEFRAAYPQAKIYVADEFRFHTHRRRKFVAQVAKGDWDGVVITYSAFKKIPVSQQFEAEMIRQEIERYKAAFLEAGGQESDLEKGAKMSRGRNFDRSQVRLQKQIQKMEEKFAKLKNKGTDQSFTFEQLGVDALLVDEAHTFRKLSFATLQGNLRGVDPSGSKAAWDLYMKSKFLDTVHPQRNLVLASGTPLTNTVGEAFTIQRFMDERQLVERGIDNFDAWAAIFATSVTNLEKQPSGNYANVTRLARFTNLPALSMMIREFMDVVTSKQLGMLVNRPNMKTGQIQIRTTAPTNSFKSYQKFLEKRMEAIQERSGPPQPGDDIILKVINDGRHAAIDMRLIDPTLPEQPSKLEDLIATTFKTWQETSSNEYDTSYGSGKTSPVKGGTQIIFSDLGIKQREKDGKRFSAYTHMKKKLVELGVPPEQIAFMRDYEKHDEKRRLFARVNAGEVRILIGSTGNMGTGVNVQNRLVAIHNLDAPWLPADLEQRIGRGLRQGNQNKEIGVYGYGTEGSYDSTMWGILETKANAVTQFLSGETRVTEMDDIEDTDSYRLAKALTSGDPRVLEQASLQQELTRLERKARGFIDEQARSRREIGYKKEAITRNETRIERLQNEVLPKRQDVRGDKFVMTVSGKPFTERAEAGAAVQEAAMGVAAAGSTSSNGVKIGEYGGFDMRLYVGSSKLDLEANQFTLFLDAPYLSEEEYTWGGAGLTRPFSALGMTSRLTNVLDSIEPEIARSKQIIEESNRAIGQLQAGMSDEFPQQSELEGKRAQLDKLNSDLQSNAVVVDEIEEWPDAIPGRGTAFSILHDDESVPVRRGAKSAASLETAKVRIEKAITSHLAKIGWPDLQVVVSPEIKSPLVNDAQPIAGSYWNRVIYLSMQNDPIATLNHELIHALRQVNAFTTAEWRQLERAASAWRKKYGTDTKYRDMGLSESELNEEAIADAFKDHATQGIFRRIINRIKRFLVGIRQTLTSARFNFDTAEDVFDAILSGKIAPRRRDTSTERERRVRYAIEENDPSKALGDAQENLDELLASRVRGFDRELPTDLGSVAAYTIHPHQIASLHPDFAPVYTRAVNQFEMRDQLVSELTGYIEGYNRLPAASKEKVNAALELGRLDGKTYYPDKETKGITITNEAQPEAVFSKVGETITLTEHEATTYLRVRRAMDKALDMYIEQILDDYGFYEQGITSKSKLEKALLKEGDGRTKELMTMALKMVGEIDEAKRKGYVPFKRWGNVGIAVKEVDESKPESEWRTVRYEQIDVTGPLDRLARGVKRITGKNYRSLGSQPQVRDALERMVEKYPAGQYEIITFPIGSFSDLEGKINLRDLDVLAASSELTQDEYANLRAAIEDSLKRRGFKAHFYKAQHTPGYSPDFERAINDYVVGISGHLARRRWAPKIDKAVQDITRKKVLPRLVKYAQSYQQYIQNPQEEFQNLRQIGFMYYIAGSLASAITNLTQVPLVTGPWISGILTPAKAGSALASAYADVTKMLAFPRTGLDVFDPAKAPDDVRDAIKEAWSKGQFVPLNTYEAMAISHTNIAALRGLSRHAREAMNWMSIKFSAAERTNRIVSYIAAYRLAKDPANREAILKFTRKDGFARAELYPSISKGNEEFARAFAEYAVISTQLRMGRLNRPIPFRRFGTLVFQFKSFMLQVLELQYRLLKIHGPQGKKAFGYIMLALFLSTGLMGLPGADDLKEIIEAGYKLLTRRDIDLETEARGIIAKRFGPQVAEAFMNGLPRVLLNVDMGRIGFGNIMPDSQKDFLGIWYDMFWERPKRVLTDVARGDEMLAFADAMPNAIGNFIKGNLMNSEGVKSGMTGDTIIPPEALTNWDALLKMAGFTSGSVANERERNWAIKRASRAADDLRADYYDRLAVAAARQVRAANKGDYTLADQYAAEFQEVMDEIVRYNDGTPDYKQVIIQKPALMRRIKEEIEGSQAQKPRKQARSRAEEITGIYGGATQ